MTNDPVEEFLAQVHINNTSEELYSEFRIPYEEVDKLLALVRVYREANQFYGDDKNWKEGKEMWHEGQLFYHPSPAVCRTDSVARAAEQKALEIVK